MDSSLPKPTLRKEDRRSHGPGPQRDSSETSTAAFLLGFSPQLPDNAVITGSACVVCKLGLPTARAVDDVLLILEALVCTAHCLAGVGHLFLRYSEDDWG